MAVGRLLGERFDMLLSKMGYFIHKRHLLQYITRHDQNTHHVLAVNRETPFAMTGLKSRDVVDEESDR
jgi:hypothetical protein